MRWQGKRTLMVMTAATILLTLTGTAHAEERLVIPGTGDSQDLLRALGAAYQATYRDAVVDIPDSTGSAGGIESAGRGLTPLGRTAVRPGLADQERYGGLTYREFARVPVVFVVAGDVRVRSLSPGQVCAIYAGFITSWRDVGGADLAIVVQTRPEDGSNMRALRDKLACFHDLAVTPAGHFNLRNADLVASMRDTAGALGFMPLSEARLHRFATLRLDGVDANADDYPLWIALALVHKGPLTGAARRFVEFLASPVGEAVMRSTGHVPIRAEPEPPPWFAAQNGAAASGKTSVATTVTPVPRAGPRISGFVQIMFQATPGGDPETELFAQRARLKVSGKLSQDDLSYAVMLEIKPPSPRLLDAYGAYQRSRHRLKLGQFKTPFGWENAQSIRWMPTPDRSLLSKTLATSTGTLRDFGVGLFGEIPLGRAVVVEDELALVNGAGESRLEDNDDKDVMGRLSVRLWDAAHVGVSAGRFAFDRPDATDETLTVTETSRRVGIDVGLDTRHGLVVAEAILAVITAPERRSQRGAYLLGLARLGSRLEAVARYELLDPDVDVDGDERQRLWVGANLLVFPQDPMELKLSLHYRRDFAAADEHAIMARTQLAWQ
jgi:phosphate transport system substrate-binding protein